MSNKLMKIHIKNLKLKGILGVKNKERDIKQNIIINSTLWIDYCRASENDNIKYTLDYQIIVDAIINHIKENKPFLIEKLCNNLIKLCFNLDEKIKKINLKVEKPESSPVCNSLGVSMERNRKDYDL